MKRRVGARALRQSLSVFLRKVAAGDTFEVTARGRSVAVLAPLAEGDALERLVASGRASAPEGDLLDLGPPVKAGRGLSAALREQRADRL
jgi:prevent-host-death family protein